MYNLKETTLVVENIPIKNETKTRPKLFNTNRQNVKTPLLNLKLAELNYQHRTAHLKLVN
jgi:hypothetical protein